MIEDQFGKLNMSELGLDKEESYEQPKIEKLFGHSFAIDKFAEESYIPIGGDNVFSQEVNVGIKGDFIKFKDLFDSSNELADKYNFEDLQKWLEGLGIDISPKLFGTIFAFTKQFEQYYPDNPNRSVERRKLYKELGKELTLSNILDANAAECAEIAALAQFYLQDKTPSEYISGDVLWKKEHEFSEPHSFLRIKDRNKTYLYDPANPTSTTGGNFPSIYTTEANFDEEIRQNQKRFVTAKNLIGNKEAYFGVSDGTDIREKHIV